MTTAHQERPSALFVGTGRSVLTAATALSRHGWRVDVMSRFTKEEILGSPPGLTQVSLPTTRLWEQELGLDLWSADAPTATAVRLVLTGGATDPVQIIAPLPGEGQTTAIDSRLIGGRWMQLLDEQGATLHESTCRAADLDILADKFNVCVIGGGENNPMRTMFPVLDRPSGASSRIVLQAHIEGFEWADDPYRPGEGACLDMYSLPGAEVLITPVVAMVPLTHQLVLAHSNPASTRQIVVPTIAGACVQILARPGGVFDTLPVDRRPAEARPQTRQDGLPDRVPSAYPPSTIWEHMTALITEQVDTDLGAHLRACELIPHSELLTRVEPQVRDAVALTGRGRPVVGIGGLTRTPEVAGGQGAAAATLSGVNLAELAQRQHAAGGALDEAFLREAMALYDAEHGDHTAGFGAMVNAYWNRNDPAHEKVHGMVAALAADMRLAALWGQGLDQPARMAPLLGG
ncbi:hypothetical protein [Nocardiopsis sp. NRRL B-16309]|uniref:hypothetical protein n=1 Tax=Nocardiopsis sp. NRRL B-16309 TaxID=1519494 RepID=UPI0006AEF790|nr:hypothetical protein [Nocardiopsis sp. NRRL B-16309]KOX10703.1 hypothetical protein ADL05_24555 [Nocardiopsis sp. NRRL B-16309]